MTLPRIRYALADTPLGTMLLAGSAEGVCALYFGDDEAALQAELSRELHSEPVRDDAALHHWTSAILAHLDGRPDAPAVPLHLHGTAFQRRVWAALQAIPPGTTRSYREVAKSLGMPTAARAVARGCATNAISVLIPCHRVIRGDGHLGGYRWGLARKQLLLDRECLQAAR
jgi:AraC family transcriptional regulator of adaptative response/methylated-DNA-[protein]-cysteine methyltransferase